MIDRVPPPDPQEPIYLMDPVLAMAPTTPRLVVAIGLLVAIVVVAIKLFNIN
jgi:hypothetical protein